MLPVVLHHGFLGSDELRLGPFRLPYFRGIDRAIIGRGHPLIVTKVHPSSSVANRARQLKESLLRQMEIIGPSHQKVILIAHSMGGLDARYALAKLGLADRVAAVLTIATPHRGSPVADWAVANLGRRLRGEKLLTTLKLDLQAVVDLTTARCAEFNDAVPDVPGVSYFSISAAASWHRMPPFALHSYAVVKDAEGENDGLVSVRSATWATHLGTWPANHWQTINRRPLLRFRDEVGDIGPYWLRALDEVTKVLGDSSSLDPRIIEAPLAT